ncbi:anti-repressor SinI family protein [Bacillus sp. UNC41MFS5]|nr:anti-repressor SinI family protein [Bacillus sp. UNC41MFS5]
MAVLTAEETDKDWLDLIIEAKELGLSLEEIKYFLEKPFISRETTPLEYK